MSETSVSSRPRTLRDRLPAATSVWVPLGIYLLSRAVSALFLLVGAGRQDALTFATPIKVTHPLPASPSLLQVATNWDGQWYWAIVDQGYPSTLPPAGSDILQSPIAFYPGYPTVVEAVMRATGAGFALAAVLVSLVTGGVAVVLLHRLLLRTVSPFVATANITLLCVWPAAAVLGVAYTEGLALLLIVLAIRWLSARRYLLAGAAALGLGLVRPLTLPLAVVVVAHAVARWRDPADTLTTRDRVGLATALAGCGLGALAWPALAARHTSDLLAYPHAMEAWAAPGSRWGGWFGLLAAEGQWVLLGLVVLVVLALLRGLRARPQGRTWPMEVRVWSGAYVLFVLATTLPTIGIARYALLALVPFWPFPDDSRPERPADRRARWAAFAVLVALALAGQYWWVSNVFTINGSPLEQSYP